MKEIKTSIIKRYEQSRATSNTSSVQPQAPASDPVLQPLITHRSINSHGLNAPTSPSTPSSSRSHAFIPLLSPTTSSYEQSPSDDDRTEHVDTLLREEPRQREEVYPAHDTLWSRVAEQHRLEVDGILRRRREAEHAAQSMRLGQPTGQDQGARTSVMPVSHVQYPSLVSPTWCVILFGDCASFSGSKQ